MRIVFFCENANQVWMSRALADLIRLDPQPRFRVAMLDAETESSRWVTEAVRAQNWNVALSNMFDDASPALRNGYAAARNKSPFLKDIVFDWFKDDIDAPDLIVVQYNDSSVKGNALAQVCRNTGICRVLVQDGFLNFQSKSSSLKSKDRNYFWGATAPECLAVWGEAMREAVLDRHPVDPGAVCVVGPTKSGFAIPARVAKPAREGEIRVLWADQAILDQNKAPADQWLREFGEIGEALAPFRTSVRLHPSTLDRTLARLRKAVGDRYQLELPDRPALAEDELDGCDVVVTYYSTIFLDCIRQGKPCVVYKTRSLDIELPTIAHPLLHYCADLRDLATTVERTARDAIPDQPTPPDIYRYVADRPGLERCRDLILEQIERLGRHMPDRADAAAMRRDLTVAVNARRLFGKRVLVLGGNLGDKVGVAKSIKLAVRKLRDLNVSCSYHLVTDGSRPHLYEKVRACDLLVINSLDVVREVQGDVLRKIVELCAERSTPMIFYCHETAYVFEHLRSARPERVASFVTNVLPRVTTFAVSDAQADWLGTLGAREIRTVYNPIGPVSPDVAPKSASSPPVVLMVGTQQPRKGLEMFSRVADLAAADGRDWRFVWLGGMTKAGTEAYRSDRVDWRGHVDADEVRDWLKRSAALFLSSVDDPMPLTVGEALALRTPALVFARTGYADFVKAEGCGVVYEAYEPEAAYRGLEAIMANPAAYAPDVARVAALVGEEAFFRRMIAALGETLAARDPHPLSGGMVQLEQAEAPSEAKPAPSWLDRWTQAARAALSRKPADTPRS